MTEFTFGEVVILNETVARDLPMRVGQRCVVSECYDLSPNFNYYAEFDDGDRIPVKTTELNKLTTEDKQYMEYIFTNGQVLFGGKKVKIIKVNYLTKQADVKEENGVEYIVEFKDLEDIHIDRVEEKQISIYEDLLNKFFNHYKNREGSYTVPKELLVNLLKGLYTE